MVSIGKQQSGPVCVLYEKRKKHDITSLLGQMCPPAASSTSFGKLGPIVPLRPRQVVGAYEFLVVVIGRACLVMVDGTAGLDRGRGLWFGESAGQRQRQRRWHGWLWGEGVFGGFGGLAGQSALATVMAMIALGHVGVVNRAVVPIVGVPLGQDAVGVMAIDMRSWTPVTPMTHTHTVETKPLGCRVGTHHVAWTTPSDDNCRRAVDGT
jgi:hypothetical protein